MLVSFQQWMLLVFLCFYSFPMVQECFELMDISLWDPFLLNLPCSQTHSSVLLFWLSGNPVVAQEEVEIWRTKTKREEVFSPKKMSGWKKNKNLITVMRIKKLDSWSTLKTGFFFLLLRAEKLHHLNWLLCCQCCFHVVFLRQKGRVAGNISIAGKQNPLTNYIGLVFPTFSGGFGVQCKNMCRNVPNICQWPKLLRRSSPASVWTQCQRAACSWSADSRPWQLQIRIWVRPLRTISSKRLSFVVFSCYICIYITVFLKHLIVNPYRTLTDG